MSFSLTLYRSKLESYVKDKWNYVSFVSVGYKGITPNFSYFRKHINTPSEQNATFRDVKSTYTLWVHYTQLN